MGASLRSDGYVIIRNNTIVGKQESTFGTYRYLVPFVLSSYNGLPSTNVLVENNLIIGAVTIAANLSYTANNNIFWAASDSNQGNFWTKTLTGENNLILVNSSQKIFDPFENNFFVNAPKFCEEIPFKNRTYSGVTLGESTTHNSTLYLQGANFEGLQVTAAPGFRVDITSGGDALTCYNPNAAQGHQYDDCIYLYVKNVSQDTIEVYKDVTNYSALVNISVRYSPSTESKIYVNNNTKYSAGEIVEYAFNKTFSITSKGCDAEGDYALISPSLIEKKSPQLCCGWVKNI